MAQKVVSRSQKRMERKQAVILVLLVLAVSLVSFSLGVMVGRGGSQEQSPQVRATEPLTLPTAVQPSSTSPQGSVASEPAAETSGQKPSAGADSAAAAPVEPVDKLTFYDTLPRDQQPLGSGINLPPKVESATSAAAVARPQAATPAAKPVEKVASLPVKPRRAPAAVAPGTGYVVQIASFKKATQAEELRSRLAVKGYVTFVQKANLGSKGIWYRVYAGPYSERVLADKAAGRLHREEKFSPLVRKR